MHFRVFGFILEILRYISVVGLVPSFSNLDKGASRSISNFVRGFHFRRHLAKLFGGTSIQYSRMRNPNHRTGSLIPFRIPMLLNSNDTSGSMPACLMLHGGITTSPVIIHQLSNFKHLNLPSLASGSPKNSPSPIGLEKSFPRTLSSLQGSLKTLSLSHAGSRKVITMLKIGLHSFLGLSKTPLIRRISLDAM